MFVGETFLSVFIHVVKPSKFKVKKKKNHTADLETCLMSHVVDQSSFNMNLGQLI